MRGQEAGPRGRDAAGHLTCGPWASPCALSPAACAPVPRAWGRLGPARSRLQADGQAHPRVAAAAAGEAGIAGLGAGPAAEEAFLCPHAGLGPRWRVTMLSPTQDPLGGRSGDTQPNRPSEHGEGFRRPHIRELPRRPPVLSASGTQPIRSRTPIILSGKMASCGFSVGLAARGDVYWPSSGHVPVPDQKCGALIGQDPLPIQVPNGTVSPPAAGWCQGPPLSERPPTLSPSCVCCQKTQNRDM